jgi:broad specificity phosphatase PhoE
MRHALTPGTGHPSDFRLGDCSTQRDLRARGREQARAIGGTAFRERGITFDVVLSSQWCRTRETAELLGLGEVIDAPELNSFFRNFERRESQTRATRELLSRSEGRPMLVCRTR